ncbi:XRE family transcriptional regulator [Streptacidiphilus rugosus]|uniref:XRE family transcriptional regulator n=1 Tax=Streptacidiphilus rugosus TaxID=405783 RepID=UPI000B24E990|nr:XRE family transcriptional regulator [Streptacidiphilus rugosus]
MVTGLDDADAPLPVDELRRQVAYGWAAFQATGYAPVTQVLPALLVDASRSPRYLNGDARRTAYALLSMAYQLACAVTTKLGDHDLAHRAADRAVTAADRSEDPVVVTGAARHLVDAMFHRGEGAAAIAIASVVAERLEPDLLARGPSGLSVLGMLHLKAAVAAAHIDDRSAVPDQLDAAKAAADRLRVDGNALWTAFGPTNVQLHQVSTMVRLDDGPEAVTAADHVDQGALEALPRERRANHLVDRALGYRLAGRREQAVDTLLHAERLAPQEVRSRPATTRLVAELRLLGVGSAEGRLRALAQRCGLPA